MGKILKIEMERAFRSLGMTLALSLGYALALVQFVLVVLPASDNILQFFDGTVLTYPCSVFNKWMAMDDRHPWNAVYMTLFPVLAVLPYGASWLDDRKSGYVKNVCVRMKKSSYLIAKYVAVFISAGVTVVVPLLFNLILTCAVLPALTPSMNGLFPVGGTAMFAGIYYTNPWLYTAIYMIIYFVYAGVLATLAIAASGWINQRFIVILFPFVIHFGSGIVAAFLYNPVIKEIGMRRLLAMTQYRSVTEYAFFGEALLLGILAIVIYFVKGLKNDIF